MTELQRILWLLARPECGDISRRMRELCRKVSNGHRRNVDASSPRVNRDAMDTKKLEVFLRNAMVFSGSPSLRSLATGMEAHDTVTAHHAVQVGRAIMEKMAGKCVRDMKFCKKDQVVTMDAAPMVTVDGSSFRMEMDVFFQRVTIVENGKHDFPQLFKYDLCPVPAPLFDNSGLLNEPNKSSMKESIIKLGGTCTLPVHWKLTSNIVLDGGSFLQTVRWPKPKNKTYMEIVKTYEDYENTNFGQHVSIIFDGYDNGPSTKDEAHIRRYGKCKRVSNFSFKPDMLVNLRQEVFLSNSENKRKFIALLSKRLEENQHYVMTAPGDADAHVGLHAIEKAEEKQTVVVAEDTDILVLLLHHLGPSSSDVYLVNHSSIKDKSFTALHINAIQRSLGPSLAKCILFLHAFLGCDTTSRLYGVRRSEVLEKAQGSPELADIASVFLNPESTPDEVGRAGIAAFLIIYGAQPGEKLWQLRHRKFVAKAANNAIKTVDPRTLAPTEDAAILHALRVYLQVQIWLGNTSLNPLAWGWIEENGKLRPKRITQPPAPDHLLKIVRCQCRGDCREGSACTCRRHGLACTIACTHCQGANCSNPKVATAFSR